MARLRLRVSTGSRRSQIVGRYGDAWKVRVSAAPERGAANAAVLDLLAASLGMERRSVTLVAGATARDKVVEIEGLELAEVEQALAAVASQRPPA
jgi:uncharacterized protein YggU (UPF0235/DUF167 family)